MLSAYLEATSYKYNRSKTVVIPVYAQSLFDKFSSCDDVFSGYDQTLLAYSQNMRKELSLCWRDVHFKQCLKILKGEYFQKTDGGLLTGLGPCI
jgi:hypothetical protein